MVNLLRIGAAAAALVLLQRAATAQQLPASPASSTEKPGKEETAPKRDETGLILTTSSRARYENVAARPRPGYAADEDAFLLRTGVAVEYGPGALAIGAELIDSRAFGLSSATQIAQDDVDAVELPQAYLRLRLRDALGLGPSSIEGGRFLINLGSGRLVSTDEYRNTVTGFTGIRADLAPEAPTSLTLFYVLPQERLPNDAAAIRRNAVAIDRESTRLVFFGGELRRRRALAGGTLAIAYYRLAEHDSPGRSTADRRLHSVDARWSREPKPAAVDYDVETVYQGGNASASTDASARHATVSAGFAHAAVGYTLAGSLRPRISLFYDWASGNGRGGTLHRFDTLFGSRREDLGPSGTYAALARENISAPGIRIEAKSGDRFEALADYRAIWLASRYDRFYGVSDPTGHSGNFGGQQVEGRLRYWLIPRHLRLESNAALLFKGGFLKDAPAALARDRATIRFVEVNVQATF